MDSIASFANKSSKISINYALKFYVSFHKNILKYLDFCEISTFDETTNNIGNVINRINKRYSTDNATLCKGDIFEIKTYITEINRKVYKDNKSKYSLPNNEKQFIKDKVLKQLKAEKHTTLLKKAYNLYNYILQNSN